SRSCQEGADDVARMRGTAHNDCIERRLPQLTARAETHPSKPPASVVRKNERGREGVAYSPEHACSAPMGLGRWPRSALPGESARRRCLSPRLICGVHIVERLGALHTMNVHTVDRRLTVLICRGDDMYFPAEPRKIFR